MPFVYRFYLLMIASRQQICKLSYKKYLKFSKLPFLDHQSCKDQYEQRVSHSDTFVAVPQKLNPCSLAFVEEPCNINSLQNMILFFSSQYGICLIESLGNSMFWVFSFSKLKGSFLSFRRSFVIQSIRGNTVIQKLEDLELVLQHEIIVHRWLYTKHDMVCT